MVMEKPNLMMGLKAFAQEQENLKMVKKGL